MTISSAIRSVQAEIAGALPCVDDGEFQRLAEAITEARRIVVVGAGRVGLACKGFAMRLMHLGLASWALDDQTTPAIGPGDLLLVCSGSGEMPSIRLVAETAVKRGAALALITREPASSIARMAGVVATFMGRDREDRQASSAQPMTTLFEQSLWLLLDALVLLLMERLGQTDATMRTRHRNLE
jgi:6-phospho-3-hexuloisomerase